MSRRQHSDDEFDFQKFVGERIRIARRKCCMPQEDLAKALDVSPSSVSKWESGANCVSLTQLMTIANLLNQDIGFFLGQGESIVPDICNLQHSYNCFPEDVLDALLAFGDCYQDVEQEDVLDALRNIHSRSMSRRSNRYWKSLWHVLSCCAESFQRNETRETE